MSKSQPEINQPYETEKGKDVMHKLRDFHLLMPKPHALKELKSLDLLVSLREVRICLLMLSFSQLIFKLMRKLK